MKLAAVPRPAPARLPSVAAAKLEPPPLRDGLILRPRFAGWMQQLATARVAVVRGYAGYGKTTLLSEMREALAQTGERVGWYGVDAEDKDPALFARGLAAAAERAFAVPEIEPAGAPADLVVEVLNALAGAGRPCRLFIDDAHHLNGSPSAALMQALMAKAPACLRLVFGSRQRLELQLARLRVRGGLVEIGGHQLSFDREETRSFLASRRGSEPSDVEVEPILSLTDGWPAALGLLAAQGAAPSASLRGAQREIADFFDEEVLANRAPDLLLALDIAAAPDRICARLFDAMTGEAGGGPILDRLFATGLFLLPLDGDREWFRVHPLLADLSRHRFKARDPAAFASRCRAASDWFEGAGLFREAVDMALRADDRARAAELLDRHSDDFYSAGMDEAILPYAALLPADLRDRYPRLLLAMSWRLQVEWRLDRSREVLSSARARIDQIARDGELPADDLRDFQNQLLHRDITQAQFEDDFAFIERQAGKLLRDFSDATPYVKGSLYGAMLHAQREQFELGQQNRLEALAREQIELSGVRYLPILVEALTAPGRLMRGQTDRLVESLTQQVGTAEAIAGPGSPLGAVVALPLAETYFERHELGPARRLLDIYLPNAATGGFADQLIAGWITDVRMLRLAGDAKGALLRLEDAIGFATARNLHRVRIYAAAEAIDINCRLGNQDEAARLAAALGLTKLASSAFPENKGTRAESARALAWTKLAQLRAQFPDALAVAKRWRGIAAAAGAVRDRVLWDLRIAALLAARGDERPARRLIQQALVAAAPGRLIHRFIDEARNLAPLMPPPEPVGAVEDDFQARFAADVLTAMREVAGDLLAAAPSEPLQPSAPVEGLSAREAKILKLVGAGLLNGEIGQQLGITEGSVKWYLQRIYDKVGSRRRLVAVEQARRMGLLG